MNCNDCNHSCHCNDTPKYYGTMACPEKWDKEARSKTYVPQSEIMKEEKPGIYRVEYKGLCRIDFADYVNETTFRPVYRTVDRFGPHKVTREKTIPGKCSSSTSYTTSFPTITRQEPIHDRYNNYHGMRTVSQFNPTVNFKTTILRSDPVTIKYEEEVVGSYKETVKDLEEVNTSKYAAYQLEQCSCSKCQCKKVQDRFLRQNKELKLHRAYLKSQIETPDTCLKCKHVHHIKHDPQIAVIMKEKGRGRLTSRCGAVKKNSNYQNVDYVYCKCMTSVTQAQLKERIPDYTLKQKIKFFFTCTLSSQKQNLQERREEFLQRD